MSKPWAFFGGTRWWHNFQRKREWMIATGKLPKPQSGEVEWLQVAHDNWCGVYVGKCCNCDPDISPSSLERAGDGQPITIELVPVVDHGNN